MFGREMLHVGLLAHDQQAEVPSAHRAKLLDYQVRVAVANGTIGRGKLYHRQRRLFVAQLAKELLPKVGHPRADFGLFRLNVGRYSGGVPGGLWIVARVGRHSSGRVQEHVESAWRQTQLSRKQLVKVGKRGQ